jgi:porin
MNRDYEIQTSKKINFCLKQFLITIFLFFLAFRCFAAENSSITVDNAIEFESTHISSNPAAVNITTGTGSLGRALGIKKESGLRIGGLWILNGTGVFAGGSGTNQKTANNLLILDLYLDGEKALHWPGASFGAEFLRFDGSNTNAGTGAVQSFNGISATAPFHRSELYELWYLQQLFHKKLSFRIGKSIPSYDFNNVLIATTSDKNFPIISGLLYTPIFVNSSLLGVLPTYYNSAYGITAKFIPNKYFYVSGGAYDGNGANGTQTGLTGPHFNGYYFYVAEAGSNWAIGRERKPGKIGIGYWKQTGTLTAGTVTQQNTQGAYAFASQRLWYRDPSVNDSGISGFFQYGINNSKTMFMSQYLGLGLTAFALTRPKDSFGAGAAIAQLNTNLYLRRYEGMYQTYYQAYLFTNTFLTGAITCVPNPGSTPSTPTAWAGTLQITVLF